MGCNLGLKLWAFLLPLIFFDFFVFILFGWMFFYDFDDG